MLPIPINDQQSDLLDGALPGLSSTTFATKSSWHGRIITRLLNISGSIARIFRNIIDAVSRSKIMMRSSIALRNIHSYSKMPTPKAVKKNLALVNKMLHKIEAFNPKAIEAVLLGISELASRPNLDPRTHANLARGGRAVVFEEEFSDDIKNKAARTFISLAKIELDSGDLAEVLGCVTEVVGANHLHIDTRQLAQRKLFEIAAFSETKAASSDVLNALVLGFKVVANQEGFAQALRDEATAYIIKIEKADLALSQPFLKAYKT